MSPKQKILAGLIAAGLIPLSVAFLLLRPDVYLAAALFICAGLTVFLVWRLLAENNLSRAGGAAGRALSGPEPTSEAPLRRDFVNSLVLPIEKCISDFYHNPTSHESIRTQHELRRRLGALVKRINWLPMEGESREVTILLADIRGFTAIAESYSPPEVMDMLNRFFTHMGEIIYRYEGTVDKFIGDSVMALFGAPVNRDDDVDRAVVCAVEMQLAMNIFNQENRNLGLPDLYMGIGVNTGRVIAGQIGSQIFSDYTVMGDEVNLAARIEASTLRGQILISQKTYERVEAMVTVKDPLGVFFKGKREPLLLYELQAVGHPYNLEVPEREIRRGLRAPVDIPIHFQVCEEKVVRPETYEARILNISTGGMLMMSDTEVAPLTNIKFRLGFNIIARQSGDIYGKVLRVKKQRESFEMNVEFTAIDPADSTAIKQMVDRKVSTSIPFNLL